MVRHSDIRRTRGRLPGNHGLHDVGGPPSPAGPAQHIADMLSAIPHALVIPRRLQRGLGAGAHLIAEVNSDPDPDTRAGQYRLLRAGGRYSKRPTVKQRT